MTTSTADKIIDIAESQMRAGGYNSFSFREISKKIGIKSASIHYHFPTKTDLGVAIANRYTERFNAHLIQINQAVTEPHERLERYIALFRYALEHDQQMCLCGALAGEADILPEPIRAETKRFFEINLAWLAASVFLDAPEKATITLASLEGALMMSKILDHTQPFDQIGRTLAALFDMPAQQETA